jgi:hypothetical protein
MTKKDYIALAAALKRMKPALGPTDSAKLHAVSLHQWSHDVVAIMEVCRGGNPKFDRNKFVTACGVPNVMDP